MPTAGDLMRAAGRYLGDGPAIGLMPPTAADLAHLDAPALRTHRRRRPGSSATGWSRSGSARPPDRPRRLPRDPRGRDRRFPRRRRSARGPALSRRRSADPQREDAGRASGHHASLTPDRHDLALRQWGQAESGVERGGGAAGRPRGLRVRLAGRGGDRSRRRRRGRAAPLHKGSLVKMAAPDGTIFGIVSGLSIPVPGAGGGGRRGAARRARADRRGARQGRRAAAGVPPRHLGVPGARRCGARGHARGPRLRLRAVGQPRPCASAPSISTARSRC